MASVGTPHPATREAAEVVPERPRGRVVVEHPAAPRHRRRLAEFWARYARNQGAVAGLAVLLVCVALAVAAPLLTPYDPAQGRLADALAPLSPSHPLGTDHLGRDLLARMLYGARFSLMIGCAAVALGLVVGVPLGAISGYYGGWADQVIQRIIDVLLSFPGILLALAVVAVLGVGLVNVIVAVGIGLIPAFERLVRAATLMLRRRGYVEAARGMGARGPAIIWRHILPNASAPIVVQATVGFGGTLLTAAGLGFLGLGVQQPMPEWGAMLGEGRQYIFSTPTLAAIPGVAISLVVLGCNLVGGGLRDALDPTLGAR